MNASIFFGMPICGCVHTVKVVRPLRMLIRVIVTTLCLAMIDFAVVDIVCGQAPADLPMVDKLDPAVQAQWDRVDALVGGGQGDEAIEILRRIADEHGDKVVALPASPVAMLGQFQRFSTVRNRCTARIAELQKTVPGSFAAYRRRLDPQAKRWLAEGISQHDDRLVRRVVDEAFLSSYGDDALKWLGEYALQRGQYALARRWFESIHVSLRFPENRHELLKGASRQSRWMPLRNTNVAAAWKTIAPLYDAAPPTAELVYPDTDLPLSDILARLVVVSIMEGDQDRARIEIDLLRLTHRDADGVMGGRSGKIVTLLEELRSASAEWSNQKATSDWPTWGGDMGRSRILPSGIEGIGEPIWSSSLPRVTTPHELLSVNRLRVAEQTDGILAYHPTVVGNRVIVQIGPRRDQLIAYDLRTGKQLFPSSISPEDGESTVSSRMLMGVPRYTATSLNDYVFARIGMPVAIAPGDEQRLTMPAKIAALDLNAEGKLVWEFRPTEPPWNGEWTIGGPPATDGEQLFICLVRRGPLRLETQIVALDPIDGRIRWRRSIGAADPPFDDNSSFVFHQLLTVTQGVVYCNTNSRAVAALDARQGSLLWLTTYPRTRLGGADPDRNDLHFYRDLNPCVVFRDLVFVGPTDCDRLFALDATTGIPVWVTRENLAVDAVHILGVGADNLIASGESLYWMDAYTGELVGCFPEPFRAAPGFARPMPRGYGRGILAGEHVYWPTRNGILVFDQRVRRTEPARRPEPIREISLASHGATGGHLVMAGGVLLVAGADRLFAFPAVSTKQNGTDRRSDSGSETP